MSGFDGWVRVHYADELRHAELLQACADSGGPMPIPAPSNLNMPHRLEQALGGPSENTRPSSKPSRPWTPGVPRLSGRSSETSRAMSVTRVRSLDSTPPMRAPYEQTITRYRAVESTVFDEQQRDFTLFLLERGLLGLSAIEDALLKTTVTGASSFGGARGHRAADRSAKPRPSF
jgi:hypothetical protein